MVLNTDTEHCSTDTVFSLIRAKNAAPSDVGTRVLVRKESFPVKVKHIAL